MKLRAVARAMRRAVARAMRVPPSVLTRVCVAHDAKMRCDVHMIDAKMRCDVHMNDAKMRCDVHMNDAKMRCDVHMMLTMCVCVCVNTRVCMVSVCGRGG
jgi:hypothetical protein